MTTKKKPASGDHGAPGDSNFEFRGLLACFSAVKTNTKPGKPDLSRSPRSKATLGALGSPGPSGTETPETRNFGDRIPPGFEGYKTDRPTQTKDVYFLKL